MAIYTRSGDDGETGLVGGSRASKASPRVEAIGTIDELGAVLGLARQAVGDEQIDAVLAFAQQRLFNCASALADPASTSAPVSQTDIVFLEAAIDSFTAEHGPWRGFVLASGGEAATRLHLARTVARRAERRGVALAAEASVDASVLAFLNRLSDLLWAAAGARALAEGADEVLWDRDATPPSF